MIGSDRRSTTQNHQQQAIFCGVATTLLGIANNCVTKLLQQYDSRGAGFVYKLQSYVSILLQGNGIHVPMNNNPVWYTE